MRHTSSRLSHPALWSAASVVSLTTGSANAQTPYLVKDFFTGYPPGAGGGGGGPERFVADDDRVFFVAVDPVNGVEIWVTDGTLAGTHLTRDIRPIGGSIPNDAVQYQPVVMDHVVYFAAKDAQDNEELWRSDGTVAGTHKVTELRPGPRGGNPQWLCNANGTLYFAAGRSSEEGGLWISDGTEAGTTFVHAHRNSLRNTTTATDLCSMSLRTPSFSRAKRCGAPTAPQPAPSCSKTSGRARPARNRTT